MVSLWRLLGALAVILALSAEARSQTEAAEAAGVSQPEAAAATGGVFQSVIGSSGGDILNEAGFFRIPPGMTYEEYRDATRRITVGILLMSVPVPGMLHFYANEPTTGWILVGTAGAGLAAIIGGAMVGLIHEKNALEDTDYETVVIGTKTYAKIPVSQEGEGDTAKRTYVLDELGKKQEPGAGLAPICVGALAIVGAIVYDWIDGIWTIEEKRDKVRYKYGIELGKTGASLVPGYDPKTRQAYLGVGVNFN